ncbi:MAG: thioredoxin family protein [Candidatus Nanoarchaeia archaeon]|nr:thioredoxin family protein [Candidatus Nanoarchaeia archaeon]MDD5239237.1 thioredoxin family protein [Candidatus Nanoarchaeia archaeon]
MVLCIIAMVVFGIMGIFSAAYRSYALEAFHCTFRLMTFRPCQSDFDQKMKTKIIAKLMGFPRIANFTNKYFTAISFIFVILFLASMAYTGYSVYNLAVYHTCDPQHPENCVFTPMLGESVNNNAQICTITGEFVEFYGAECPHCLKMEPVVAQVETETGVFIQKLEVWHNETNQQTMVMHAENITNSCGSLGVPAFYATKTGKAVCGEMTVEQLKDFIRQNGQ